MGFLEEGDILCKTKGGTSEVVPYPLLIDGGATASVMGKRWCAHVGTLATHHLWRGALHIVSTACGRQEEHEVHSMRRQKGT